MQQVLGCSVSYRVAIGPQQGRNVFTLQTIPAWEEDDRFAQVAKVAGLFRTSSPPPLRGQLKLFKIVPDDFVSRKSRELNRLRQEKKIFQAYPASFPP
jgi:hypothetical protein